MSKEGHTEECKSIARRFVLSLRLRGIVPYEFENAETNNKSRHRLNFG